MPTPITLPSSPNPATIPQPQLVIQQQTLEQVADRYLKGKALEADKHYISTVKFYLRDLILSSGTVPIDIVNGGMIQQVILGRDYQPSTQKAVLKAIQTFFRWSRSQGYLPMGVPTAADSITVQIPHVSLPILSPDLMMRLLWCANDVSFRVAIALRIFSDLDHSDLPGLDWPNFTPGRTILIKPGKTAPFGRLVPIRPVLDAWLHPFYGQRGSVFSSADFRRFRRLARKQRVVCDARILRRSYLAYASAFSGRSRPSHSLATPDLAREYFSLTPARIGIGNWPEMVAEYLTDSDEGSAHPTDTGICRQVTKQL